MKKGIQPVSPGQRDLEGESTAAFSLRTFSVVVGWGDCDPAQIAYTARIPDWALKAIEDWYRYCLMSGWFEMNIKRGIGTPFVALSCEFHAPVRPDIALEMKTFVARLGNTSLSHLVEGFQRGIHCFSVAATAAFVDANTMKPTPIPNNMRRNILQYIDNQGRAFP